MSTESILLERSDSKCELCGATGDTVNKLSVYGVPPHDNDSPDECVLVCGTCHEQINAPEKVDVEHWRCLNDSMWNQNPAVQVMAWRMLTRLRTAGWPQNLLDTLYLEDDILAWAQTTGEDGADDKDSLKHLDSNGVALSAGDTVTLIKDLNVKGAGFTAKRGTAVRGISLVPDNAEHIEGRVEGQHIVILTKFVKKSN